MGNVAKWAGALAIALIIALIIVISPWSDDAANGTVDPASTDTSEPDHSTTTSEPVFPLPETVDTPPPSTDEPVVVTVRAPAPAPTTAVPAISQELIELLTVDTVNNDCVEMVKANSIAVNTIDGITVYEWSVGSLAGTPPRLWSDAMSVPFVATEPAAILAEHQLAICQDPLLGFTWANYFARMEVGGVDLVSLNEWLEPYAGDPSEINDYAARFMPLLDADLELRADCAVTPENSCLTDASRAVVVESAHRQDEYGWLAERVNTLFERFVLGSVEARMSVLNYHLAGGGVTADGLSEVEINDVQEDLPALVLFISEKDVCVPVRAIGINVGDKRPELFETPPDCEELVTTTTTSTVPGSETTSTTPGSTPGTTTPGTTPGTTTPGTTPETSGPTTTVDNPSPTTTAPDDGKDDTESPVSDDENDPDEVTRPNVPAPTVVIRPNNPSATTQPAPQPTVADPPEVQNPQPALPTSTATEYVTNDPSAGNDANGDGIPD